MQQHSFLEDISDNEKKEIARKRELWKIAKEKNIEHEKMKQKKIKEYETRRAKELGLPYKGRSPNRSRSKSRSRTRSKEPRQRSHSRPTRNSEPQAVPKKVNSTPGSKPLFNGPSEAPKLSESELRQIIVKIHRKIPAPANLGFLRVEAVENSEIQCDVVNPEEITLKRREGEGMKPIFDRDELKQTEVEEYCTIEVIRRRNCSCDCLHKKRRSKSRSVSLSPRRHRSPSPHSRSERSSSRLHKHRSRSREDSRRHRSPRRRSKSRERDCRRSERDYPQSSRSEKDYREHRSRSKDRSYDRRDRRDSSAERHHSSAAAYIEPMPYPPYFGSFPPRPEMIPPALALTGLSSAGRGRMPVAPIRPPGYPPRFVPPNMYRGILPPDPRYPRMF